MQHWHHAERHVDLSSTNPIDGAAWASTCCDCHLPGRVANSSLAAPPWRNSGDIWLSPTPVWLEAHRSPGATWSRNLTRCLDAMARA